MKHFTQSAALLLAGLLCLSFAACSSDDNSTLDNDNDNKNTTVVTTVTPSEENPPEVTTESTTTATPTTTKTPTTDAPDAPVSPDDQRPDVLPSALYTMVINAENAVFSFEDPDENFSCTLSKYGSLIEYYEVNSEGTYEQYYDLSTHTTYYFDEGKWHKLQDEEEVASFEQLLNELILGPYCDIFVDANYSKYDSSFKKYYFDDSLLDPQNGTITAYLAYPYDGDAQVYFFQKQIVDRAWVTYAFTAESEYQVELPKIN